MSQNEGIPIQRYRLVWWKQLVALPLLPLFIIPFFSDPRFFTPIGLFLCALISLIICWDISSHLYTYLELSPSGIKYHTSPFHNDLVVSWDDVEKIEHFPSLFGLIHSDYLVLKQTRAISPHYSVVNQQFVDLCDFHGWPRGNLFDYLKTYAPRLVKTNSTK
jgi:hypothetical protein